MCVHRIMLCGYEEKDNDFISSVFEGEIWRVDAVEVNRLCLSLGNGNNTGI